MSLVSAIRHNFKTRRPQFILLIVTAVLITVAATVMKTPPYNVLPLYVSLFVMLYQSEANRFAHLFGGANAVLYGVIYYSLGVYASAASSVFFSFPVSMITFICWNKRAYKKSVVLRKMTPKILIITVAASVLFWISLFFVFKPLDSEFAFLDNTTMVFSILTTILTLLAFREYPIVASIHILFSLFLKIQLTTSNIANLPFLIYTSYNTICHAIMLVRVRRMYKEQNFSENKVNASTKREESNE